MMGIGHQRSQVRPRKSSLFASTRKITVRLKTAVGLVKLLVSLLTVSQHTLNFVTKDFVSFRQLQEAPRPMSDHNI